MSSSGTRRWLQQRRTSVGFLAGALAVGVLASGGAALAAIPSSTTGQFTACVAKVGGAVRIIDAQSGKQCTRRERTVRWSVGWRHLGAWAASTAYKAGSVVTVSGSSYVAKVASTGKAPGSNPSAWGLIAAAGATGAPGATGATGASGATGATGATGLPGAVASTTLHYSGTTTTTPALTYVLARTLGTFTKQEASTKIRINWFAHAQTVSTQFCHWSLRIDGADTAGDTGTAYNSAADGNAVLYNEDTVPNHAPLTASGTWSGLSTGTHTAQVWVRGNATSCVLNFGSFGQTAQVDELR